MAAMLEHEAPKQKLRENGKLLRRWLGLNLSGQARLCGIGCRRRRPGCSG